MADDGCPGIESVALLASAGGLEALSTILRDLPPDFPAAVVVQQRLGSHNSVLSTILRRLSGRSASWAVQAQVLAATEVVVCPAGMLLEVPSDGCCHLRDAAEHGAQGSDVLLASMARSYGPRSVGVVLSGSGHDGAAGTAAMKRAGAVVIAESPDTARYQSMPIAAARAGADLVLPVQEISHVLADIVGGAPLPELRRPHLTATSEREPVTPQPHRRTVSASRRQLSVRPPRRPAPNSPACALSNCSADAKTCRRDFALPRRRWQSRGAGPRNRGVAPSWLIRRPRKPLRAGNTDSRSARHRGHLTRK